MDIKKERHGSMNFSDLDVKEMSKFNEWPQTHKHEERISTSAVSYSSRDYLGQSADSHGSSKNSSNNHGNKRHRVPYFRYFGPTAIVPGFKRMMVNVPTYRGKDRRKSRASSSSILLASPILGRCRPLHAETVLDSLDDLPVYDQNDASEIDPLIISLVKTFFLRLGCNYPFLREERCLQMIKEKRMEPMLVDVICALAARFYDLSIRTGSSEDRTERCEFGHIFAQRAKAATVDTFSCPSIGAVQACLLMAYEAYGENEDSTLWMYLGLAIRMIMDLGLQKMAGVKMYQGEKDPWYTRTWSGENNQDGNIREKHDDHDTPSQEEQTEIENERMHTFWAVFVLDRVISSGTGRPVTFRDNDFDLAIPEPTVDPVSGLPAPFSHFITIIHLYGRVSDVLNNISQPSDLNPDKMKDLAQMEIDLTWIYHNLDSKLVMSAQNFQEYVKIGQGTTFILMHFWIHALFVILHQPMLVTPFGSFSRAQLLPNSHELSMSSAKSIADILTFADLIDAGSIIGNPFTSQPIYIAACAFLLESASKDSVPFSRTLSPRQENGNAPNATTPFKQPGTAKHLLLTANANQNYQRCYKSLQHLHEYWGGVKYILTALEQRQKGIWDCETYTDSDLERARLANQPSLTRLAKLEDPASPNVVPLAVSLTGTTDSPNPSLTLFYPNGVTSNPAASHPPQPPQPPPYSAPEPANTPPGNMIHDPIRHGHPAATTAMFPPAYPQPNMSAIRHPGHDARSQKVTVSSVSTVSSHGKSSLKYETVRAEEMQAQMSGYDNSNISSYQNDHHSYQQTSKSHSHTPSSHHSSASVYESPIIHDASPISNSAISDSGQNSYHGDSQKQQQHHHHNSHDQHSGGGDYHSLDFQNAYHNHNGFTQSGLWSNVDFAYPDYAQNPDGIPLFDSREIDLSQYSLSHDVPASAWLYQNLPDTVLEYLDSNLGGDASDNIR